MKNKLVSAAGVAAVLAAAALAAGAGPATAAERVSIEPHRLVPALSTPQEASDVPEAKYLSRNIGQGVNRASLRLLGSSETEKFFVGTSPSGSDICLVATLDGPGEIAAASCIPRELFAQEGAAVKVSGPVASGQRAEAYLVPDDVDTGQLTSKQAVESSTRSSKLLIVNDNSIPAQATALTRVDSAVPFTLNLLGDE